MYSRPLPGRHVDARVDTYVDILATRMLGYALAVLHPIGSPGPVGQVRPGEHSDETAEITRLIVGQAGGTTGGARFWSYSRSRMKWAAVIIRRRTT